MEGGLCSNLFELASGNKGAWPAHSVLSPGVEVSRPGVKGVELLSRDRGVEACRGAVEAC